MTAAAAGASGTERHTETAGEGGGRLRAPASIDKHPVQSRKTRTMEMLNATCYTLHATCCMSAAPSGGCCFVRFGSFQDEG